MFVWTARRVEVESQASRQPVGQEPGVRVVLDQPVEMVVQRVVGGGGEDPRPGASRRRPSGGSGRRRRSRSASPASIEPPGAPRPLENATLTMSNGRGERRDVHAQRGARRSRDARRRGRGRSSCARATATTAHCSATGQTTPPARLCVFSTSTTVVGGWSMCPRGLPAASTSSGGEAPAAGADLGQLDAARRRRSAGLVPEDVRLARHEDLVAGPRQRADRDLVGHRPGREPERGLVAEHRRDPLLEPVDRRVLAELVVADLGAGHRLAHRRRGPGDGIGAQVDERLGGHGRSVRRRRVGVGSVRCPSTTRSSVATCPMRPGARRPSCSAIRGWPGSSGPPASRISRRSRRARSPTQAGSGAPRPTTSGSPGRDGRREVMDAGGGPEWTRWWRGGAFNHAEASTAPRAARDPAGEAVAWEGEDGEVRRLTNAALLDARRRPRRGCSARPGVGPGRSRRDLPADARRDGHRDAGPRPDRRDLHADLLRLRRPGRRDPPRAIARRPCSSPPTASSGAARSVPMKAVADEAVALAPSVGRVIVVRRLGVRAPAPPWNARPRPLVGRVGGRGARGHARGRRAGRRRGRGPRDAVHADLHLGHDRASRRAPSTSTAASRSRPPRTSPTRSTCAPATPCSGSRISAG